MDEVPGNIPEPGAEWFRFYFFSENAYQAALEPKELYVGEDAKLWISYSCDKL